MKKITLILASILFSTFSFAQTPQLVPGNYQLEAPIGSSLGSLGECVGLGNSLVFAADNSLWITDGTSGGTLILKDFVQNDSLKPTGLTQLNGKVYFFADDGIHGIELWSTDGTVVGTSLLKDINPGPEGCVNLGLTDTSYFSPYVVQVFNNKIYFGANDNIHGTELWESDGTVAGTILFQDINPGTANGIRQEKIRAAGNKLYFMADAPAPLLTCLFATDGTVGGATMCMDSLSLIPSNHMLPYNDKVIFSTYNGISSYDIFVSDGTPAGTFIIVPGKQNTNDIAVLNNNAYFFASTDLTNYPFTSMRTDGTLSGTQMYYDNSYGIYNINSFKFFSPQAMDNHFYYFATHLGVNGIWKSDGTTGGTALLDSLGPYTNAYHLTPFNGKLYFKADNGQRHDLWYTDGTASGTQSIPVPGTVVNDASIFSSRRYYKSPMISTGNVLYFYNKYDSAEDVRIYKLDIFPESVGKTPELSSIDIYPNPTQGYITIDAENAKSITIHSIEGKQVHKSEHLNSDKTTIDTHQFASGTYTVTTLLNDGSKRFGKFVKQ